MRFAGRQREDEIHAVAGRGLGPGKEGPGLPELERPGAPRPGLGERRLAKGDLRQAAALAEQAVAENGKNAEFRVTLAEVLMAANLLVRAKEEAEEALSLAPNNPRAKALSAALKKT